MITYGAKIREEWVGEILYRPVPSRAGIKLS